MTQQYVDKCPKCGGQLYLANCQVCNVQDVPITPDGFSFVDASHIETGDEMVYCADCQYLGELALTED